MTRLAPLLASVLATDIGSALRRARRNAVLYALAGLFFLSAYAAALIGGGLYLASRTDPMTAALVIAAGMVALALLLLAGMALANAIERRKQREHGSGKALAAAAAISILPTLAKSKGVLGMALLGGIAVLVATRAGSRTELD